MDREIIGKRQQSRLESRILDLRSGQVLYDKKWIKFLKRTWLFRYIPFVDFVLAAGSMATGNVNSDSDFDVIVAARHGRIFTARFFCIIAFGIFGWRRKRLNHKESAADKVCLNHFITPSSYKLSPPHNSYLQNLYQNLVPLFGDTAKINQFFATNANWMDVRFYSDDLRHSHSKESLFQRIAEKLFGNSLGDWIEKFLRRVQITKIERSLKTDTPGYKPRIKYNDEELEFHPDTRRTEAT